MPVSRQSPISAHVATLRTSISDLDRALTRLAASLNGSPASGSPSRSTRKLTLTPARRAALKLQGQYMGYLRNLKPRQKAEVKAVRETKGIGPAIAAAKRLGKVA